MEKYQNIKNSVIIDFLFEPPSRDVNINLSHCFFGKFRKGWGRGRKKYIKKL